jgi:HEAT repeat protein
MKRFACSLMPLVLAAASHAAFAAEPNVDSLARSLSSDNAQTRVDASRSLSRLDAERIAKATDALTKALGDSDPFVRAYAALALGKLEQPEGEVVADLARLLTDPEPRVRGAAVRSLRRLKPGPDVMLPIMIKTLEEADPQGAMLAIETIAEMGGEKAIAGLTNALKNERARYWACLALGEAGSKAKSAVPALVDALSDERTEVQIQALIALGKIGPEAASAVDEIAKFVKGDQPATQYAAAYALGEIAAPQGADALKAARRSDDPMLKTVAAWGLAKISPDSKVLLKEAAEQLVASLKSDDKHVRTAAARGLADLKPEAQLVRPALIAALADDDPAVRGNIVDAVAALGATAVPDLMKGLKNPAFREASAVILARIGPAAKGALPGLLSALDDASSSERSSADDFHAEALVAIALIGPQDPAVVKKCTAMLQSENERVRRTATYALGKAGASAKPAAAALRGQLGSDDEMLRVVTLWALLQITPQDPQIVKAAIPGLIKALEDQRPLVRLEATLALGRLGPKAAAAKDALAQLADDPDEAIRQAAAEAIEKIGE